MYQTTHLAQFMLKQNSSRDKHQYLDFKNVHEKLWECVSLH